MKSLEMSTSVNKEYCNSNCLSIVTVVFNDRDNLEATIKSVLKQKPIDFQYVVIDGGSTDGTLDVIKKYESIIDYWISESDEGIYDAMNKAVVRVSCDWVIYLNAGDEFYNGSVLGEVLNYLDDSVDLVIGDYYDVDQKKIVQQRISKFMLSTRMICHQTVFFKRAVLESYPYNLDYRICSDFEQFCRLLSMNVKMRKLNLPVVKYLGNGLSIRESKSRLEEKGRIIKSHYVGFVKLWGILNNYRHRVKLYLKEYRRSILP